MTRLGSVVPSVKRAPELIYALRGYTRQQAAGDVTAGVIVGIVALPLAIAFAIASGLPPEYGIYTAIIAGFLISALGGSRVQIGGPTGAFVVIVYGIVQVHGIAGLTVATVMAGLMLIIMGVVRLGAAIKFIPFPVTTGFTSGIAVVIATSQIRDLLGLRMDDVPAEFVEKWGAYAEHISTFNPHALIVAGLSLAVVVGWPRISRTIPAPFVAVVLGTIAVPLFGLQVETIGSRFGDLSIGIPRPTIPAVSLDLLRQLVGPAFTIALLAAVESLLSAVVADGMTGMRHRSNVELVGQGVANVVAPLFGGMPATGAIARTATNVRSGGRTPVAGMVHAVTILLIGIFFGRWVAFIPLAALASILIVVAYHMSEWRTFAGEFSGPRSDIAVLLTTFLLTVLVDLTIAIEAGMVLAAFLFMKRMAEVTNISAVKGEFADEDVAAGEALPDLPSDVAVYEINGPFFFGAAEKFKETVNSISSPPRVLVLVMRNVPAIDSTGVNALRGLIRRARSEGTRVLVTGVHAQPMTVLARTGFLDEIGDDNLFGTAAEALEAVRV
ncbi:MAG TPA: SulP family inorganic anion transporter [Longimicrobiales bacterium]|nr:SulP family inorganic anion transporter [Longimicrobiales bacterium]